MKPKDPSVTEALIVAVPETAGSALYGMVDVLAATGTVWQQLVGREPVGPMIRPRIVSPSREPFRCGNGIPVVPDLAVADRYDLSSGKFLNLNLLLPGIFFYHLFLMGIRSKNNRRRAVGNCILKSSAGWRRDFSD